MKAIFVYGLLKPGFRLHHVVEPFVVESAPATAKGRLYDAGSSAASPSEGLPAARFDEDGTIDGVVFWIDDDRLDEALNVLDELEDEGTEYRRTVLEVDTGGRSIEAFAYEYLLPLDGRPAAGSSWR